jgi:phage FluMu protein Com
MIAFGENIKVRCPHCKSQTWVRDGYNDPCQHCDKIVQTR